MINKEIIDEAFVFYNIDKKYKERCYEALKNINSSKKYMNAFKEVYTKLYINEFSSIEPLWEIENIYDMFIDSIDPFATNLMVLAGYRFHIENIKKYKLDDEQIIIHKNRVKECFESDLLSRGYESIRISKMLWAAYFIRVRLLEIFSLQFEYKTNMLVKIHIPKNTDLNVEKVKKSIEVSKELLPKIYNIKGYKYMCTSWLLSNQVYKLIDKETNISKFYDLFKVEDGDDCLEDILNFVFGIEDYFSMF